MLKQKDQNNSTLKREVIIYDGTYYKKQNDGIFDLTYIKTSCTWVDLMSFQTKLPPRREKGIKAREESYFKVI